MVDILHGKGVGSDGAQDQGFLTESYHKKRCKGLKDKDKLSADEKIKYGIVGSDGGGRTDEGTYQIEQFPFPIDQTIRRAETLDIRKVKPELGEMSD